MKKFHQFNDVLESIFKEIIVVHGIVEELDTAISTAFVGN